jgi:putative ABC transport system substrate-binding protein
VQSLAHPGGNLTGFLVLEPSLGTKLLELLKEVAPSVARIAILFNPDNPGNGHHSKPGPRLDSTRLRGSG